MTATETTAPSYYQIGEVSERTGLTQRTLRYYEEKGLLSAPARMEGGFRLYTEEDIERIEQIKRLKDLLGFSLAEIKEMMSAEDVRLQIRAGWRKEATPAEKAEKIRQAQDVTRRQLALVDQKLERLDAFRASLIERLEKYDAHLARWEAEEASAAS